MKERRKFTRISTEVKADVFASGFVAKALKIRNLSLKGAFIVSDIKPSLGKDVKLLIRIPGDEGAVEVKGVVMRKESDGFAVEFKEIELSSFIKLKSVIASNLKSSDELENNIKKLV